MAEVPVSYRYDPASGVCWFFSALEGEVVMNMLLDRNGMREMRDVFDQALAKSAELDEEYRRELERANRERVEPLSVEMLEPGQEPI